MSNKPKKTVTGEFGGVYGPGGVLNIGKNKTTQELLNNIPESNLNSNEIIENNIERSRRMNMNKLNFKKDTKEKNEMKDTNEAKDSDRDMLSKHLNMKEILKIPNSIQASESTISSPFKIIYIVIILAILIIVALFFFYKDNIMKFINDNISNISNVSKDTPDTTTKDTKATEIDKNVSDESKLNDSKSNDSKSNDSAIKTLNNKLNNISPYKESNVTSDGFCYIGYDDGQRECVDVYQGDVCMSGEIFPSLDICINPKLRP